DSTTVPKPRGDHGPLVLLSRHRDGELFDAEREPGAEPGISAAAVPDPPRYPGGSARLPPRRHSPVQGLRRQRRSGAALFPGKPARAQRAVPRGAGEVREVARGASLTTTRHWARSVHRLIEPLIVERAEHRAELVAELLLRVGGAARVVGLLVLPGFD